MSSKKTQAGSGTSTATDATTPGKESTTARGTNPTDDFYKAHEVHTLVQLTLQQIATSWNGAPMQWGAPRADVQATSMGGFGMAWPALGMFPGAPLYRGVPQPVSYWYP